MNVERLERLSPGEWFHDVRDQLKWHVYRRSEQAFELGNAERDALSSEEMIRARQTALKRHFISSLGGLPEPSGPPRASVAGALQGNGFSIQKLIYESRPKAYVTSLLYLPDDLRTPAPAILFLCGHATQGKAYPEYQRVCQLLARTGFVVLAQDPIGQGERLSYWEPRTGAPTVGPCTSEHDHAGAQCAPLGWSIARFFLHDAMRSLDYLCSRPEVDPKRIGLTGNSGGGTQSCLLMMTDARIAAAAPGTFIMNRQSYMYSGGAQDAEQIWPRLTSAGYDHEDVLIAMAPRPVCVLAVTGDFFPIEGTRETVRRCRRVWETLGVPNMPRLVEDASDHAYTRKLACASARFFAETLMQTETDPDYDSTVPLSEADIRCTASGQVRGDFADAESVFEECQRRLDRLAKARSRQPQDARMAAARQRVSDLVRRNRTPCDANPRTYASGSLLDLAVEARIWWSQPGLMGHGLAFRVAGDPVPDQPVTVAVWDGGTSSIRAHMGWIRQQCAGGRRVLVPDVSGVGALRPHDLLSGCAPQEFYGVIHKLADDLTWLGDSLAALRTYDVLRATDVALQHDHASDVRVYADAESGRECLYGILAATVDERISGLDVHGPPPNYADWISDRHYDSHNIKAIILPGILEQLEVDDLC